MGGEGGYAGLPGSGNDRWLFVRWRVGCLTSQYDAIVYLREGFPPCDAEIKSCRSNLLSHPVAVC